MSEAKPEQTTKRTEKYSNFNDYYSAALAALRRANEADQKMTFFARLAAPPKSVLTIPESDTEMTEEQSEQGDNAVTYIVGLGTAYMELRQTSAIAVVFSALSIESLLNYVLERASTFYTESYDKLEPAGKLVAAIQFVYNKKLAPGDNLVGRVKVLNQHRNKLVHNKPRHLSEDMSSDGNFILLSRATEANDTCRRVLEYFKALDSTLAITLADPTKWDEAPIRKKIDELWASHLSQQGKTPLK